MQYLGDRPASNAPMIYLLWGRSCIRNSVRAAPTPVGASRVFCYTQFFCFLGTSSLPRCVHFVSFVSILFFGFFFIIFRLFPPCKSAGVLALLCSAFMYRPSPTKAHPNPKMRWIFGSQNQIDRIGSITLIMKPSFV